MPTSTQQMIDRFVRIGQAILACNRKTHYGPDETRIASSLPAQPGFLGNDYRGLVFLGQQPGAGAGRTDAHEPWKRVLEMWQEQGTDVAYAEAFELWRLDLGEWPVWTQWVQPILDRLGLTEDQIGYLNLCKNATSGNRKPTARMFASDWTWTSQQLELLQPRVVVAGGLEVAKQLKERWPAPPCIVIRQNRARSQNRAERMGEADALARQIRSALAGSPGTDHMSRQ